MMWHMINRSELAVKPIDLKVSCFFEQFCLGLAGIGTSYASYSAKERFHNLRLSIQKPVCVLDIQIPTGPRRLPIHPRFANMVRPGSLSITLIDSRFLIKVETEKHFSIISLNKS